MTVEFPAGVDSAIVLNYGQSDQYVVRGINQLAAPGVSSAVITVDEFRKRYSRKYLGGASYDDIAWGGTLAVGDTEGQDFLRQCHRNKTKLTGKELCCFLDYNHFFTTDLANDSDSSMQIGSFKSGQVGKNDTYPVSGLILPNGDLALYSAHMIETSTPTLNFVRGTAAADTITDSGNGFVTAGFKVGMSLLIINSTSNDSVATTITTVAAGTLTLACEETLTAEAGVEGTMLHGGTPF